MHCQILNQSLTMNRNARLEWLNLCRKVDRELIFIDRRSLLLPGNISDDDWTMTFEFSPMFKEILCRKFTLQSETGTRNPDKMNREELKNYILENDLDVDAADYEDQPLEKLAEAVKEEDFFNFDKQVDCKFDHIGFFAWMPEDSQNGKISIYLEMDSDDSTWPLIKGAAKQIGGEILLDSKRWDFYSIAYRSFDLVDDINPEKIAREITQMAEKLWKMANGEEQPGTNKTT